MVVDPLNDNSTTYKQLRNIYGVAPFVSDPLNDNSTTYKQLGNIHGVALLVADPLNDNSTTNKQLDGAGPVDNRPSTDYLPLITIFFVRHVTPDM